MTLLKNPSGTLPSGRDSRLEIVLLTAGIVTIAFGLLALLGWVFGWLRLASFGVNLMPMAPSTAALFLLYGAAIGVRARTPLNRRAHGFSVALAGIGTLVALVLFALGWLHIQWAGEHLGLNITGTVAGARTGHISLVTAFCFLLAGVSFLASLSPSAPRPWRVGLALVSAVVLLGLCFVFLLAYGFGTPLLYGSTFIPPALNTILAFITLGLALMALAGRSGGLFCGLSGDDSKPAILFALVFLFLTAGIVAGGYVYYRNFERKFRVEAEQQLATIADLKVHELMLWRQERLADGGVLFQNAAFSALVRRVLEKPADADAPQLLQPWLAKYAAHFPYDEVRLLDTQGVTRLSVPAGLPAVSSVVAEHAAAVRKSDQVAFQDFFRSANDRKIHLAILVPIRDETDVNRPLGVIVLRIDPSRYLYPFISRWPVPSATAETLLIRREGNEAVFLNELRFQTNTALTLRRSLANTNMPAVKAALGQEGLVAGSDYRGVPVLAALRAVPDSPWFLVARRDVAEVYAPLRAQLWQVITLVGALLFGAGAGVSLVWRQQRVRFYQREAQVVEALQKSQRLLTQAEKLGCVGGWEFDIETRLQTWTETVYNIHELEVTCQPTVDQGVNFYTPTSRPIIEQAVQRAIEQGVPFDLDLEIITAKGNRRSVHTTGTADLVRRKVTGFFQDITNRKQAEATLRKFAMLADSSSEFIGMCDLDLNPLYVNSAGLLMVGLPDMAAACKVKVQDYFFPEDQRFIAEEFFPRVLREGHGDVEIRLRHFKTGEPIWMFYYLFNVRDASGEIVGWATVSRDISERKRAEEAMLESRQAALNLMTDAIEARDRSEQMGQTLRASEEEIRELNRTLEQRVQERTAELRAANQELDAFAYAVSHDLRQPLRAMNGFSRALLEDQGTTLPGAAHEYLDEIILASRRMGDLIDGVLRLSRCTRGELRRDAVAISELATRILGELVKAEPERHVSWTVAPGLTALGDERMLEVVLSNLLGNAWKYTANRTDAVIEVGVQGSGKPPEPQTPNPADGFAVFFVRDNGAGFDMKHAAKLFQPFQRLHRENEFPGLGIGLATVQRIVNRHGGSIQAAAGPEQGATFYFSLPVLNVNDEEKL